MKKVFFVAFFVLVFFVSCSDGKNDIYGDYDDEGDYVSEVSDSDREGYERPDEAPMPGGATGSESGNPSGSNGSKDDESAENDDESAENDDESAENDDESAENDDNFAENDDDFEPEEGEKPDEDGGEEGIYALEPDVVSCTSGIPSESEKKKVLDRINYLRAIHKLNPVVYDEKDDEIAAECALVIAANEKLSHEPDNSWKCWSQVAYDGCNSSNIHIAMANYDLSSFDSSTIVDGFMTEEYQVDPKTLGHRRWLIDPWLSHIAFGRADYYDNSNGQFVIGSAIKVINDEDAYGNISGTDIKFVAYPFENYPAVLYNDNIMMSFTVIKDKVSKYSNATGINFASATVAIIDPDNKTMKVKNIEFDTQGFGVPNNLRWYAEGIKPNVKYNVTISNIMINNNSEFYQYWFELK